VLVLLLLFLSRLFGGLLFGRLFHFVQTRVVVGNLVEVVHGTLHGRIFVSCVLLLHLDPRDDLIEIEVRHLPAIRSSTLELLLEVFDIDAVGLLDRRPLLLELPLVRYGRRRCTDRKNKRENNGQGNRQHDPP